jgi:arginase
MTKSIAIIGAPSSAGAYSPGQEKAPAALRGAGLIQRLKERDISVVDYGDVEGFRWRPDGASPRAMNIEHVARVARDVAAQVGAAAHEARIALVIGGDCTVELGTIAGLIGSGRRVGLVYVDFDADMNTPETTTDGALDWMGVAHMLALPGTDARLSKLALRSPMLAPGAVLLFGAGNIKPHEQEMIAALNIATIPPGDIAADPKDAARRAVQWAAQFDALAVHLDVDVIDFEDFPIAENTRRKQALSLDRTMAALTELLAAPNLAVLTLAEINPDHGAIDGETVRIFAERLAAAFTAG